MIFPARCEACGRDAKFIEFKAEPCTPGAEGERRYGFRCLSCKTIVPEIVDANGARQYWEAGRHVEAPGAAAP
jgi:DNA-directed RNA polymerase subunit N (RpoN/RPB10)